MQEPNVTTSHGEAMEAQGGLAQLFLRADSAIERRRSDYTVAAAVVPAQNQPLSCGRCWHATVNTMYSAAGLKTSSSNWTSEI